MPTSWIAPLMLAVCVGFSYAQSAMAAPASSSNDEETLAELQREVAVIKETSILRLEAQKESLQAQKESLQKDLQLLQSKIDAQDKRIQDINAATDLFSAGLAVVGLFVTIVVAGAGYVTWRSAGPKAKEAAQDWIRQREAELVVDLKRAIAVIEAEVQSLQKHSADVGGRVAVLDEEAAQADQRIQKHIAGVGEKVTALDEKAAQADQRIQKHIADVGEKVTALGERAAQASQYFQEQERIVTQTRATVVAQMQANLDSVSPAAPTSAQKAIMEAEEKRLTQKPPSHYTFEDWKSRAFAAYALGEWDRAADFFLKASKANSATPVEVARSLVNGGVMLSRKDRSVEAIACYDEVISRFGDAQEVFLRELVAIALFNKGVRFGALQRHQEAITLYDEVVSRLGDAEDTSLRAQVAKAVVNKGGMLGALGRHQEAIVCYEEVLSRFGDAKEPSLRDQVVRALNGIGFSLVLISKRDWANGEVRMRGLVDAEARFIRAHEQDPNNPVVIGNWAYVQFLSGRRESAGEMLHRALKLGGEKIYKGTIQDTETDTVLEDAEFRSLVDKTWAEVQTRKT